MLKKICAFVFVIFFAFSQNVYAASSSAASAVVMDADSLEVLYQQNPYEERSMASTTKIMTALIACESGRLNETVNISFDMVNTIGSVLGLREGDKITLYDLVVGMLLPSGNDAANAGALFLAGSFEEFARLMNEKAAQLGMKNSCFVTPSGLDDGNHHSTAYDMALLTAAAIHNKYFAEICRKKSADVMINGNKLTVYNHNKLLSYDDNCIGVKTGYTDKAGRCLVTAFEKQGRTFICVTLNDGNDWNDHQNLIKDCSSMLTKLRLKEHYDIKLVGAGKSYVPADIDFEIYVLDKDKITMEIYYYPFVYAPVKKGDKLGSVVVKYNEKEVRREDITASDSVDYYYGKQ